jgi:aspartyl protease family protein
MTEPADTRNPASTLRLGTLALLAFWLVVAAALYAGFSWWESRQRAALQPYAEAGGQLVIPRQRDGHFYVDGEVNHQPVRFLVDTGASAVAVTEAVARAAGLPEGHRITVQTANGAREGRKVHGVPVQAGPLARNDVTVTIGLRTNDGGALLGQSFLRHFDVEIGADQMRLRPR